MRSTMENMKPLARAIFHRLSCMTSSFFNERCLSPIFVAWKKQHVPQQMLEIPITMKNSMVIGERVPFSLTL